MICAYCNERRAVQRDHVIPQSYRKTHKALVATIPAELLLTVPSCLECNLRRGTRKLVPESWADRIPQLKEYIPGEWRVWMGSVAEPAYREVHR